MRWRSRSTTWLCNTHTHTHTLEHHATAVPVRIWNTVSHLQTRPPHVAARGHVGGCLKYAAHGSMQAQRVEAASSEAHARDISCSRSRKVGTGIHVAHCGPCRFGQSEIYSARPVTDSFEQSQGRRPSSANGPLFYYRNEGTATAPKYVRVSDEGADPFYGISTITLVWQQRARAGRRGWGRAARSRARLPGL